MFVVVFLGLALAVIATVAVFVLMFVTVVIDGRNRPVGSQTKSSAEHEAVEAPNRTTPHEETSPICETPWRGFENAAPDQGLQSVGGDS